MADSTKFVMPSEMDLGQLAVGQPTLWLNVQLALKRLVDIVGTLVLLVLLAPVLIAAGIAVKLSSPGSLLFKQKRWGRGETQFMCLKFRSMCQDHSEAVNLDEVAQVQTDGKLYKPKVDMRVTKVGAFLRKTSIDELPQLLNVLVGDMSLVGPRPLMTHMLEPFPELRKIRCQMRPGLTGLWQISARHLNESALQMAPYDLEYIREFNLWKDVVIVVKTPTVVLIGGGAH